MKGFQGEIVIKPKNLTAETCLEIAESIHQQLRGNLDYILGNIDIHIEGDSIFVRFDECKGEIPEIKFFD